MISGYLSKIYNVDGVVKRASIKCNAHVSKIRLPFLRYPDTPFQNDCK